jgi:hypothetical protein
MGGKAWVQMGAFPIEGPICGPIRAEGGLGVVPVGEAAAFCWLRRGNPGPWGGGDVPPWFLVPRSGDPKPKGFPGLPTYYRG